MSENEKVIRSMMRWGLYEIQKELKKRANIHFNTFAEIWANNIGEQRLRAAASRLRKRARKK